MTLGKRWLRSVVAVLAGYAVIAVFLRVFGAPSPAGSFVWFACATILAAIAGGFATAWVAGSHEIPHAAGLGLLMIVATLVSMFRNSVTHPGWSEITAAGCGPIAAMLGASLRILTKRQP
ncbi:MAG: hypothetical protein ABJC09_01865 [Terriglobia bacterium]